MASSSLGYSRGSRARAVKLDVQVQWFLLCRDQEQQVVGLRPQEGTSTSAGLRVKAHCFPFHDASCGTTQAG